MLAFIATFVVTYIIISVVGMLAATAMLATNSKNGGYYVLLAVFVAGLICAAVAFSLAGSVGLIGAVVSVCVRYLITLKPSR